MHLGTAAAATVSLCDARLALIWFDRYNIRRSVVISFKNRVCGHARSQEHLCAGYGIRARLRMQFGMHHVFGMLYDAFDLILVAPVMRQGTLLHLLRTAVFGGFQEAKLATAGFAMIHAWHLRTIFYTITDGCMTHAMPHVRI